MDRNPVPGVDRGRTVVPVKVVDIPDQDINSMGSIVKTEEVELAVNDILQTGSDIESRPNEDLVDALQLVCPQESTGKDVPDDGEASELRCDYIRKSVDEAELGEAEADVSGTQLLTLMGKLNGVPVKFLVDSGASGNFISEHLVNEHGLQVVKSHDKMQVHLADGSTRASNRLVQEAQVTFNEHAEFLDFRVMKLPKYDAILGKSWLDRWNPDIDWREGTISLQVGNRMVILRSDKPTEGDLGLSSIFEKRAVSRQISAQQMKRLARKEQVYMALVRPMWEDSVEEGDREFKELNAILELDDAKIETPFPREVKDILVEFEDIFPKELPAGLPPKRAVDHKIDLLPGTEPPHRAPYRMSTQALDELKKQLKELTDNGYIQPSVSPFGAPVLFVPKKDGGFLDVC